MNPFEELFQDLSNLATKAGKCPQLSPIVSSQEEDSSKEE